jgi:hypothetical protein
MLRDSITASSPHLEASVKQLMLEDSEFDQSERRTVHREFLVRPVLLELRENNQTIEAFSRNISFMGISLITRSPVLPHSIAKLKIYRLNTEPSLFLAECRWTGPFGGEWNLSGWNFLNV